MPSVCFKNKNEAAEDYCKSFLIIVKETPEEKIFKTKQFVQGKLNESESALPESKIDDEWIDKEVHREREREGQIISPF